MVGQQRLGLPDDGQEVGGQGNRDRHHAHQRNQQAHACARPSAEQPAERAASAPPGRMAGSSKKSAVVPAMMGLIGCANQAISRRAENTRPCTSGATFACQMA